MNTLNDISKKAMLCAIMLIPMLITAADFDSLNVRFVGNWPLGPMYSLAIDSTRNLAYCGSGGMVTIYDITDPAHPVKISDLIRTRGFIQELYYDQVMMNLYVAAGEDGLAIWSVLDPAHPSLVGKYRPASRVYGVTKSGRHAYVTFSTGGLLILDVNDPSRPYEVGRYNSWGETHGVQVIGHYAYVADALLGLRVIDIAYPVEPVQVGCCNIGYGAVDVSVEGIYAYLAAGAKGLRIIDISDPTIPREKGCFVDSAADHEMYGVLANDTLVYTVNNYDGFGIISVADPTRPVEIGALDVPARSFDLCQTGSRIFIATWEGLSIVDVADPTTPVQIHYQFIGFDAQGIDVVGNYAYLAYNGADFHVLDVSDPTCPIEVGSCETGSWPWRVFVSGSYAYTAEWVDGLCIIDIADPTHPVPVGRCNTSGLIMDVFVAGDYAYLADDWGTFHVVDISDPSAPLEVGVCDIPNGRLFGVMVAGFYAYCTDNNNGDMWVIDVSDPTQPAIVGVAYTSAGAMDCQIRDQTAYIACWGRFMIADISNPTAPFIMGQCNQPDWVWSMDIEGLYAYTGNDEDGSRIINISNPSTPVEVGHMSSIAAACDVHACSSYIYVMEGWAGLQIYQNMLLAVDENPGAQPVVAGFRLLGNPVRAGRLKVQMNIKQPSAVEFILYDISGRQAKAFPALDFEAGNRTLDLDVRDMSAGIYFLRSETQSKDPGLKVIIVE